jgi:hypothetical protein
MSEADRRCQQALVLWLRWNDEHQQLTESMYCNRQRPAAVEALLDRVDALRSEAVAITQEALTA